jgi:hypothetical protein
MKDPKIAYAEEEARKILARWQAKERRQKEQQQQGGQQQQKLPAHLRLYKLKLFEDTIVRDDK